MRMLAALVLGGCCLASNAAAQRGGPVEFLIAITVLQDQAGVPRPRLNQTSRVAFAVRLYPDGRVEERSQAASGANRTAVRTGSTRLGPSAGAAWRVASPEELVRVRDYPSYTNTLRVRVRGRTCEVSAEFRLKPGHTAFVYPVIATGQPGRFVNLRVVERRCEVRELS